jgi:hypothetical protein
MDQTATLKSTCEKFYRLSPLPSTDSESKIKYFNYFQGIFTKTLVVQTGARITWHSMLNILLTLTSDPCTTMYDNFLLVELITSNSEHKFIPL